MKALILTEGGKGIGLGHLTRCTSLYEGLRARGVKSDFIVSGDSLPSVNGISYKVMDWLKESGLIFKRIPEYGIVAVDSYRAGISFYDRISREAVLPVFIDDNVRLNYPQGVVINGSIYAASLRYKKAEGARFLLGPRYAFLRREFWSVPQKNIRQKIQSVMVTFGGIDPFGLTEKVLKLLKEEFPSLRKNIIIGKLFTGIKEIKSLRDSSVKLILAPSASSMLKVMLESDIAVSGGGQTLYELARVGTPTIGVCVADNQKRNIEGWEKVGFLKDAGMACAKGLISRLRHNLIKMQDYKQRCAQSEAGRRNIDGKAAKRIGDYLVKTYKKESMGQERR